MNLRRILLAVPLASLLATVGPPARSATADSESGQGETYTLAFEPTQNALAGSYGVMTIKPLPGGTLVAFKLRGGYPNTVYTRRRATALLPSRAWTSLSRTAWGSTRG